MPSLKAIRKRISSVRNTQQITKAMKMVAAAKLRRAQEAAMDSRPYAEKMADLLSNVSARVPREIHPLFAEREEKRLDLLLITSDRGLCGGYNANLIRRTETFLKENPDKEVALQFIGRKGTEYFRRRGVAPSEDGARTWDAAPEEIAAQAAQRLIARYLNDHCDATYVIFSRFRSALSQIPTVTKIMPVPSPEVTPEENLTEYLFEPSIEGLLSSLLPKSVEVKIYQALLEAVAGEHGARMTAMDSATNNASEMIEYLTLQMNRARQAAITKELLEVVSTAEALS